MKAWAQKGQLAAWWQEQLQAAELSNAWLAAHIVDMSTHEAVLSYQAEHLLTPASVLKLLTTATALYLLGEDFRYATSVYAVGVQRGDTLQGYLLVQGSGDPTLGSRFFSQTSPERFCHGLAKALRQAGIVYVTEGIRADESLWGMNVIPPGWTWDDLGNYYAAPAHSINWRDNTLWVYFEPDKQVGKPARLQRIQPAPIEGFQIYNEVLTGTPGSGDRVYADWVSYQSMGFLRGTYPANGRFAVRVSMPHPARYLLHELKQALRQDGIILAGKDSILFHAGQRSYSRCLYTHHSPPLIDIIRVINQQSINLFAEALWKTIAQRMGVDSYQAGKLLKQFWKQQGVPMERARLYDGSGLSPLNAISASNLTQLLQHIDSSTYAHAFRSTLAVPAGSGTLKNQQLSARLKVFAKTGSMTDVVALAGYCFVDEKRRYAFALLTNRAQASYQQLMQLYFRLLERLALLP